MKRMSIFILLNFFLFNTSFSQQIFQCYYNIMNPMMMDGEGYAGHSIGLNLLYQKMGFELEWARTRKKHDNRYWYINPQAKVLLNKKERTETSKYTYLTLGFNHFWALKPTTFNARAEQLTYPPWDTLEGALVYNEYKVLGKQKSTFIQLGIERVAEKHVEVQGIKYYLINPVTWVVVAVIGGPITELDYTRTFRLSLFAAPPGWLRIEQIGHEPVAGGSLPPGYPAQKIVLDPVGKNMLGLRMGWQWTTLKFGSSFGLEMTMVPGVFSIPGVYGRNFPDDNIFIKANFGLAIGSSDNN